jgi:hypothetical protein
MNDDDEDDEEAHLLAELKAAAEQAAASLRRLTQVLRRIDLLHQLQHLEAIDSAGSPLGADSSEGEIADAAIARAMGARR